MSVIFMAMFALYFVTPIYAIAWGVARLVKGSNPLPGFLCAALWGVSLLLLIANMSFHGGRPTTAENAYEIVLLFCSFIVLPIGAFGYLHHQRKVK